MSVFNGATGTTAPLGAGPVLGRAQHRLGFGCGQLYAGARRSSAIRLLEQAIDLGMTYFDTARMYGHGEAEGLLGEIAQRRRDKLVIATKAGILPERHSLTGRIYRKAATMARKAPGVSTIVPEPMQPKPTFGQFALPELRTSLETSLRALRTDYVDILLLHECSFEDATNPEVLGFLRTLQQEGKIKSFGSATSVETTAALNADDVDLPILQFRSNAWEPNVEGIAPSSRASLVTHSVLGPVFRDFTQRLKESTALRAIALTLDIDPDDVATLAKQLLARALIANPTGVVLFSTHRKEHLDTSWTASGVDSEAVERINQLVAADRAMTA